MDPFIGEIRLFPYAAGKTPVGWALCDGSLLQISTNAALYSLINTLYGGDGKTTFALPDLRGRVPMHRNYTAPLTRSQIGNKFGVEGVTVTQAQVPAHSHSVNVYNNNGTKINPSSNVPAIPVNTPTQPNPPAPQIYAQYVQNTSTMVGIHPGTIAVAGSSAAHENRQPYLVLGYFMATTGIYPPRD